MMVSPIYHRVRAPLRIGLQSIAIIFCLASAAVADRVSITGQGSAAAAEAFRDWGSRFSSETGVTVDYQTVGSGGGISQIRSKGDDFGVSSTPLSSSILSAEGLIQWPYAIIGIVPVVNIPDLGPTSLKLNGNLLAQIYLGQISSWNDARIAFLNPSLHLPNITIRPTRRSDGDGETYAFTSYLAHSSSDWKLRVGVGTTVEWPTTIGAKGDDGVAAVVGQSPGSIGYVNFLTAQRLHLSTVQVENLSGRFAPATPASLSHCVKGSGSENGAAPNQLVQGRGDAWAICEVLFALVRTPPLFDDRASATFRFFGWIQDHGEGVGRQTGLVLMPPDVVGNTRKLWMQLKGSDGKALYP